MKNQIKKTVFLCGPIRGRARSESLGWRLKATKLLQNNFTVVHALRGREEKETFPDRRLAIARDLSDIERSDIILVKDDMPDASMIGTSMEIFWANKLNKVIIAFGHAHEGDYFFDNYIHARVDSLEDACELCNRMFKD